MGKICAIDGRAVTVKGDIAPDRPPKTRTVDRQDILDSAVGRRTDKNRQLATVGCDFALGSHIDIKRLDTFDSLSALIDNELVGDIFVKLRHYVLFVRGNQCGIQNLAHLVGIDIVLLAFAQSKRCGRESSPDHHHKNDDIDYCICIALLIHKSM